jgi:hypothetical protein
MINILKVTHQQKYCVSAISKPQKMIPENKYSILTQNNHKLHGLSPRANYTNRVTAAAAKLVPTLADRGMLRIQHGGSLMAVISLF